ncbi:N-6 DNA methylase, partial [Corynebacterium amycolatum]
MIDDANDTYGINSQLANKNIRQIKKSQLLGVEYDAIMYTLAASNMILRGDGSSQIKKGDTFKEPTKLYTDFNANKLLLNPPFSADNYGMPFLAHGLRFMSNKEHAKA